MHQRHSILEVVAALPFVPMGYARHSLQAEDRLGNPACDFPIGIVFADSDFFGSEGADDLVRNSKHFATGRSQLFKFEDATHSLPAEKPEELAELLIGFNEGTIRGRFEPKPKYEVALAPFPAPSTAEIKAMN